MPQPTADGYEAVVKPLVTRDDVKLNSKNEDGHSLLAYAAQYGHEAVVKIFVAQDNVDLGGYQA